MNSVGAFGRHLRGRSRDPKPRPQCASEQEHLSNAGIGQGNPQAGGGKVGLRENPREILERSWRSPSPSHDARRRSPEGASSSRRSPQARGSCQPAAKAQKPTGPQKAAAAVRIRRVHRRRRPVVSREPPAACSFQVQSPADHPDVSKRFAKSFREVKRLQRKAGGANPHTKMADPIQALLITSATCAQLSRKEEATLVKMIQAFWRVEAATRQLRGDTADSDDSPSSPAAEPSDEAVAAEVGLSSAAEVRLVREIGPTARELMEKYNIRLVISIAKKYDGFRSMDFKDLIYSGIEGLHKAIERFDPDKGFKFSTYGHWWVRQAITRSICSECRAVRLPVHVFDKIAKVSRAASYLRAETGEEPSIKQLAAKVDMKPKTVAMYLRLAADPVSMESPALMDKHDQVQMQLLETLSSDDDAEGILSGSDLPTPEEEMQRGEEEKTETQLVNSLLQCLKPRERNVIRMYLGLNSSDGQGLSFMEIGTAYGLSPERTRQIWDRAIAKLKAAGKRDESKAKMLTFIQESFNMRFTGTI